MTRVLITAAFAANLILVDEGKATRYDPGIMDRVVQNRLKWRHITPQQVESATGFVALQDKQYIGRQAWIRWPDGLLTGPYLVVDCGAAKDQQYLDGIRFAVDLSWELAVQFDVLTRPRWGVRVYVQDGEREFVEETYQLEGEE